MNEHNSQNWQESRLNELFEIENFKRIGKEHDLPFQILYFLQQAKQQMSLALTLTLKDEINASKELKNDFRAIMKNNQELQDKIRKLRQ